MIDTEVYLKSVLNRLATLYNSMERAFDGPDFVEVLGQRAFRYSRQTELLAIFLKGVKVVSALNASFVLLRDGYTQEMGVLCRVLDDLKNEIIFLLAPLDGGKYSKDQIEFLRDFFEEELNHPQPIKSTKTRRTTAVRKVHAGVAKVIAKTLNPSDAQDLFGSLNKAYSGYVHGAYPHIMELYGGTSSITLHFHMKGINDSHQMDVWRNQFVNYVYRAIPVAVVTARKLGLQEEEQAFTELLVEFEQKFGLDPKADPERSMKKMKAN
jgi:hypothetical protein